MSDPGASEDYNDSGHEQEIRNQYMRYKPREGIEMFHFDEGPTVSQGTTAPTGEIGSWIKKEYEKKTKPVSYLALLSLIFSFFYTPTSILFGLVSLGYIILGKRKGIFILIIALLINLVF